MDFEYNIRRSGNIEITGYHGKSVKIAIPQTIEDHPVVAIGDNAFSWSSDLISVTVPEGVLTIGEAAFSWCESLQEIHLPSTVRTIGEQCADTVYGWTDQSAV